MSVAAFHTSEKKKEHVRIGSTSQLYSIKYCRAGFLRYDLYVGGVGGGRAENFEPNFKFHVRFSLSPSRSRE